MAKGETINVVSLVCTESSVLLKMMHMVQPVWGDKTKDSSRECLHLKLQKLGRSDASFFGVTWIPLWPLQGWQRIFLALYYTGKIALLVDAARVSDLPS